MFIGRRKRQCSVPARGGTVKGILISLNLPDTESVLTVKNGGKVLQNFSAQQCIDMFTHFGELFKGKFLG